MSSWTLTIEFGSRADLVFAVTDADKSMPAWQPKYTARRHTSADPPVFIEALETWDLNDIFALPNVDQGTMIDNSIAWFRTWLEDTSDPPTGAVLALGGVEKFVMRGRGSGSPTHEDFHFDEITIQPFTAGGGASYVRANVRLSGIRRAAAQAAVLSYGFTYRDGFERRTLHSEVFTRSGTSAQAAAETLGLLSRPNGRWRYETVAGGAGQVDVERNAADTVARGVCVIQEQGLALASGTIRWDDETIERTTAEGTTVTVRYEAHGTGALSAVRGQRPSDVVEATVQYSDSRQTASAVYITERRKDVGEDEDEEQPEATVERTWAFEVSGGGRPETWTPIMRGQPWLTVGSDQIWQVRERHTVVARGVDELAKVELAKPLWSESLQQNQSREFGPHPIERAASSAYERWERGVDRLYLRLERPAPQDFLDAVILARKQKMADYERPERRARGG